MASSKYVLLKLTVVLLISTKLLFVNKCYGAIEGCYTSIFSFGDSTSDTGNLMRLWSSPPTACIRPPYGETLFDHPTGRCSDGRLIIDFIGFLYRTRKLFSSSEFTEINYNLLHWFVGPVAQDLGLPLLQPYFADNASPRDRRKGVNFAVAGSTALNSSFLVERGILDDHETDYSLRLQLDWFREILPSLCETPSDCKEVIQNSLIIVGEIGGNDFNYGFFKRRSIEEIRSFVPLVVDTIASSISELIELGVVTLMVPGDYPIGCLSKYLSFFMSPNEEDYDPESGCLIWLNDFSEYYNEKLRIELDRIQEMHPHTTIIYADYYNAAMSVFRSPTELGFTRGALTACCGAGGPYNVNISANCGYSPSKSCDDPSQFVNWDGVHLTEAANRLIAKGLLEGPFTIPHITTSCLTMTASSQESSSS